MEKETLDRLDARLDAMIPPVPLSALACAAGIVVGAFVGANERMQGEIGGIGCLVGIAGAFAWHNNGYTAELVGTASDED
jgi:hypothetical protein